MRARLLTAFALALCPALALSGQQAERVSLDGLLDRAGWYLESFIDEFENVVAEEIYTRTRRPSCPVSSRPDAARRRHCRPPRPTQSARDTATCAPTSCWRSLPTRRRWSRFATCW